MEDEWGDIELNVVDLTDIGKQGDEESILEVDPVADVSIEAIPHHPLRLVRDIRAKRFMSPRAPSPRKSTTFRKRRFVLTLPSIKE